MTKQGQRTASPMGPIPISESLRRLLVLARRHHQWSHPCIIVESQLREVEESLECAVPNALLAILAAHGRSVTDLVERTDDLVAFHEASSPRDWRRQSSFDHVAFDVSCPPEDIYYGMIFCFRRSWNRENVRVVGWRLKTITEENDPFLLSGKLPASELGSFETYARWKWALRDGLADRVDLSGPVTSAELEALQPCVVRTPPVQVRRVRHPKFGEGVVVRVIDASKIEVDFGPLGTKRLLQSAVSDA